MPTNMVAVITASDPGIGKVCAVMLAEQGYDIGITWRSDESGARDTAEQVCKLGRIDVLVNNAGTNVKGEFLDIAFDDWRNVFTVDVDGAFVCGQIAARQMVKQGEGGRIINITSVHEHTPLPGSVTYIAARHALGGLTKAMALSLLPHNILVNAVAPGTIATPMNDMENADAHKISLPNIPAGRPGDTREIASMVAWLCSE